MTRHRLLRRLTLAGLALASCLSLPALAAEDYPQRPIRLIIPYPPGGSLDPIGRVLAEELWWKTWPAPTAWSARPAW